MLSHCSFPPPSLKYPLQRPQNKILWRVSVLHRWPLQPGRKRSSRGQPRQPIYRLPHPFSFPRHGPNSRHPGNYNYSPSAASPSSCRGPTGAARSHAAGPPPCPGGGVMNDFVLAPCVHQRRPAHQLDRGRSAPGARKDRDPDRDVSTAGPDQRIGESRRLLFKGSHELCDVYPPGKPTLNSGELTSRLTSLVLVSRTYDRCSW